MAKRKWLFIGSLFLLLVLLAAGSFWLYLWSQSGVVRQKIIAHLQEQFDNVDVRTGTVWWLPWSSIQISDFQLIRRDDPTRTPFLTVHQLRIYPDKEQYSQGKIIIRRIELDQPHLKLERSEKGTWNVADILRIDKSQNAQPLPLMQMRNAQVTITDRQNSPDPLFQLHDISGTMINDPLPVISLRITGKGNTIGDFAIQGQASRLSGYDGSIDLSGLAITPELLKLSAPWLPKYQEELASLRGTAVVHLDLKAAFDEPISPNLRIQFRDGRWAPAFLPTSLEAIRFDASVHDGNLIIEKLSANAGTARLTCSLDLAKEPIATPAGMLLAVPNRNPQPPPLPKTEQTSPFEYLESRLRKLEISVQNLTLHAELFNRLPARLRILNEMFSPVGSLDLDYSYVRRQGVWHKKLVARPCGMDACYRGFQYPVKAIQGTIEYHVDSLTQSQPDIVKLDLSAEGCGSRASIKGTIKGSSPDLDVDLVITGKGITLDKELVAALPDDNPRLIERLHATAFGDFSAHIRHNQRIRQEYGPDVFDNLFKIQIQNGTLKYDEFPYELENLTGTLIIRTVPAHPTRLPPTPGIVVQKSFGDTGVLEFHDFKATHRGAEIRGSGRKDPVQGGSLLKLEIFGQNVQLDGDLRNALSAIRLDSSWKAIDPQGRINCNLSVRLMDRSTPGRKFNPIEDLRLSMAFNGATVRPNFFAYSFTGMSGAFEYLGGRVRMEKFVAHHGPMRITLPKAEVLLRPGGGYWADLRDVQVTPFIIDPDFIKALPAGLRANCEGLDVKGKIRLHASRIVIDEQPSPYQPNYLPMPGPRVNGLAWQKQGMGIFHLTAPGSAINQDSGPLDASNPPKPRAGRLTLAPSPIAAGAVLPTIYWDGSVILEGASTQMGVPWEDIHGRFACWGVFHGDRLGAVRGNLDIARMLLSKQPVHAIRAKMWVDPKQPDLMQIDSITGKFFNGEVGGQGWVAMQSPPRYALNLQATRIELGEIAKHYQLGPKVHLEGLASAQLYLHNKIDDHTGVPVVEGAGTIDVPKGKLLNLPVLLNLIKVAKLRQPDQTGFEEAHILFGLKGKRIKFGQLDLIGNAISLGGEGEMNADGSDVNLSFYPVWTKMREFFSLPGSVSAEVSKMVFKIRVSGQLDGKLEYKSEPVPVLVDPIRRVMERMKQ